MQRSFEPLDLCSQGPAGVGRLLCEGGDERIVLDPLTSLNRYLCAAEPDPGLAAFGSSTASTISPAGFAAAERLAEELADELRRRPAVAVYQQRIEALRIELLRLCGLEQRRGVEVLIASSGTDLHRLLAGLLGSSAGRPLLAIIGEPAETGSGVPSALTGERTAIELTSVPARAADGRLRDEATVDADVEALAVRAVGELRRVLLVVTDVSKTGLVSPSVAMARELCRRFPGWIDVLVDACQMRASSRTLGGYLDLGWMVAVTGSKFLTGPAFSGALFVPRKAADRLKARRLPKDRQGLSVRADWPGGWAAAGGLEEAANFGLLVRWEAALAELRAFRQVAEDDVRAFLAGFERAARETMAAHAELEPVAVRRPAREPLPTGGWDETPSIFPFLLKGPRGWLGPEQVQRIWGLMRHNLAGHARSSAEAVIQMAAAPRVELGQPVSCGERGGAPVSALRLCASARLVTEASRGPASATGVLVRTRQALAKAAWLTREVAEGRL
jgi:selenocysteine lyase/cysteine desulfurase